MLNEVTMERVVSPENMRAAVMQAVKTRVRIPMPGGGESLNVAAAAAICLFETVRQRP